MHGIHHRHRPRRAVPAAAARILAVLLVAGACTGGTASRHTPAAPGSAVVVASFDFPESELLAQIYGQALAAQGVPVRMELDLGTREMVLPAFQQGLVDVVPEYIGSALQALSPGAPVDMTRTATVEAGLEQALVAWHGQVLAPSPAQDQNGLVVSRLTAARYSLRTVSDLAQVADELTLTAPPECARRPYCLLGLERVYGLRFGGVVPLATDSERVTALQQHVADVAVLFTTSPEVADPELVMLQDDRHLQPADNVAPLVSDSALRMYGSRLTGALDAVSSRLDSQELLFLNWRVAVAGRSTAAEAHGWLVRRGLVARS